MPTFRFETCDGVDNVDDEIGVELADAISAKREALIAILELVREKPPSGPLGVYKISVRDGDNSFLFEVKLVVEVKDA